MAQFGLVALRDKMEAARAPIRLNLGCGLQTHPGWVNVDGSWNARLAKHPILRRVLAALRVMPRDKANIAWSKDIYIHDIRKPLPFADGSASAIYASHVLEHLYREEGERLIKESFRVLQAGGILRVVVPDLRTIVEEYIGKRPFGALTAEQEARCPADRLNERLLMRTPRPPTGHLLYRIYDAWQDFHSHKWMYDAESLGALLRKANFEEVQRRDCFESQIPKIEEVEDSSRIANGMGVCIEGRKP